MEAIEIVKHLQRLFQPDVSPGQAFDALFKMRQARVMWPQVVQAMRTAGRAQEQVHQAYDEDEDAFECPGCGVGRTDKVACAVPYCPENPKNKGKSNDKTTGKFHDPVLTFGQYRGKKLTEVAAINPSYLTWLSSKHEAQFWRDQARMAQLAVEVDAPLERDTSDTGYFG